MLLALPLGELSPQVTERAHAVSLGTKVLSAVRKLSGVLARERLKGFSPILLHYIGRINPN